MSKKTAIERLSSGWLERTVSNARLGGSIAAQPAKGPVKRALSRGDDSRELDAETKERVAGLIAEQTGKLKGLAMTLGQMLSCMDHTLPDSGVKRGA